MNGEKQPIDRIVNLEKIICRLLGARDMDHAAELAETHAAPPVETAAPAPTSKIDNETGGETLPEKPPAE